MSSPTTYRIHSSVRSLQATAYVSELIDEDTRWWNSHLICSIFSEADSNRICSLALSPGGQHRKLIRRGTPSSVFSVWNAYHLEKERLSCELGESSLESNLWLI